MRKIIVLIQLTLVVVSSFAQLPEWSWATGSYLPIEDVDQPSDGNANATDSQGNVYITGYCSDNTSFGNFTVQTASTAMFLAKYDTAGTILWLQLADNARGSGVCVDANDNVYVTGSFSGTAVFGNNTFISNGSDIFIAKYDSNGILQWAIQEGGNNDDKATDIAVDNSGNIFITGGFRFVSDFSGTNYGSLGTYSVYFAKYDSNGNLLFVRNATSPNDLSSNSIFISASSIYLTGSFYQSATFQGISLSSNAGNEYDIFLTKYDLTGSLVWAKQAGGSFDYEYGNAIIADDYGNVYITGECGDTATFDSYTTMGIGSWGSYLFWGKYDSAGNMLWIKTPQQSNWSWGESILTDPSGNIYVAFGTADSCIFSNDTSVNSINILKSDTSGTIQWIKDAYSSHRGGFCCESINDIAYYNGAIYGMGNFYENASFDSNFLTSYALYSVFLAKLHLECSAYFTLTPDSVPYHYTAVNMSSGEEPLTYSWDWGDGNFDFTPYPSHIYADTGTYTICLSITDNSGCSNTYCSDLTFKTDAQMVYVNVISSVNEDIVKPQNNSILVYPNPATTELTIVGYNPASLKLCNTLGQTVAEAYNTNKLQLAELQKGLYLLQVFDKKGGLVRVEKVVKE